MASNAPNYNVAVGDGPAAADVTSAVRDERQSSGLFEQAGTQEGNALGFAVDAGVSTGLNVYHGSLMADEKKDIQGAIDSALAAVPANAAAARAAMSPDANNPAGQFASTADRLYAAMQQGKLSASAFQLRLDSIVKQYSDKMPGWASDFRKRAAEMSGVSHVSSILAKASKDDEQIKADWEFALKADQAIMTSYGLQDRSQITPEMRQTAQSKAQADSYLQALDTQHKTQVLTDEQTARNAQGQIAAMQQDALVGGLKIWQDFTAKNGMPDMSNANEAGKLGQAYTAHIDNAEQQAMLKIGSMRQDPKNPLSFDDAKKLQDDVHSSYENMRKMLQSQQGQSVFKSVMENAKGQAEYAQNQLRIAMPLLDTYTKGAMLPKMMDDWFKLGRDKEAFRGQYGDKATEVMDGILGNGNPAGFAQAHVAAGDGVPLATVAKTSGKDAADLIHKTALEDVKAAHGDEASLDKQLSVLVDNGNLVMQSDAGRATVQQLLASGGLDKTLNTLSPEKADKHATTIDGLAAQSQAAALDTITKLTAAKTSMPGDVRPDRRGRLIYTGREPAVLDAVEDYNDALSLRERVNPHMTDGASTTDLRNKGWTAYVEGLHATRDAAQTAFDKAPATYVDAMTGVQSGNDAENAALQSANERYMKALGVGSPAEQASAGQAARASAPAAGEAQVPDHAPGKTSTAPDVVDPGQVKQLVGEAVKKYPNVSSDLALRLVGAESSGDRNAVSNKGARGLTQLMPDAAAEMGVTDVHDPAQSVNGGVGYLSKLIKRYGGDEQIALAAYNWGPSHVDAVKKSWDRIPQSVKDYVVKISQRSIPGAKQAATAGVRG